MKNSEVYQHCLPSIFVAAKKFCLTSLLAGLTCILAINSYGQQSLSGATPLGLAPGAPAGSYALSGFETVNLFNGNLNFNLPLVSVGGRGGASAGVSLQLDQKWTARRYEDPVTEAVTNYPEHNAAMPGPWYAGATINKRTGGHSTVTCWTWAYGDRKVYQQTLTRLTVTMADGTEMELRDTVYKGEAKNTPMSGLCPNGTINRGKIFVSTDGSAATFVSDTDIEDEAFVDTNTFPGFSGYLYLKDGSRWRFTAQADTNRLTEIRDKNGNKLTFAYTTGTSPTMTIKDSLNRQVVVTLNYTDGTYGLCAKVEYKGFGAAARTIFVTVASSLSSVLRSGYSIQNYDQLFPSLNGSSGSSFNPPITNAVILPNGKSYSFKYNSFGELARVVLPTGGAIEYDWGAGDSSTESIGGVVPTSSGSDFGIYRRVLERRTYADGSTLESKTIYDRPASINSGEKTSVIVETKDGSNNLIAKQKSYFWGSAQLSYLQTAMEYSKWRDGREYLTESYHQNSYTLLRSVENFFAQRAAVPWWTGSSANEPPNDTRVTDTVTTLADDTPNLITKTSFDYDQYNNQTDVKEYDYCSASNYNSSTKDCSTSWFVRRTHTDYLTTNSINSTVYDNPTPAASPSPTPTPGTIHIRNLPSETWVSSDSAGSTKVSRTRFEYDDYSTSTGHAALTSRSSISGHDSGYTTSYTTRGNVTAITRYLTPGTPSNPVTTYQQYDIAGNVVKIRDARGYETTAAYGDSYGAPNGNATTNSSPSELSGVSQTSYAFATSVTNALSQTVYSQFDFYTGMPVDGQDVNGVVTSGYSTSESLDRPTQIIRAVGQSEQSQTTFAYDDTNKKVTTTSDLSSYNDNALKTETLYDGLGRTTETRRYEDSTNYIKTTQTYDALGRIKRSYNPHRTTSDSTYGYAENTYDSLGRVTAVATSDGSQVTTAYNVNIVTVTDQASKQRKSVTDALGRLKTVYEPDQYGTLNVNTDYTYNVLNNLTQVSQGSQTRTFVYDSLSRLTAATNPESGTVDYDYDANGNLVEKQDPRSIGTYYTYDALNRITVRDYDDGITPIVNFYYDSQSLPSGAPSYTRGSSIGRLVGVTYGSSSSNGTYRAYDKLGRVTEQWQRTDSTNYEIDAAYNKANGMTSQTYPGSGGNRRSVSYSFDAAGRLSSWNSNAPSYSSAASVSSIGYAAQGAMSSQTLGNGLVHAIGYNTRLQPTSIQLGSSGATMSLSYTYGTSSTNNGNITSIAYTGGGTSFTQAFTYDNLNRLATSQEQSGSSWTQTNGYDRYGNRTVTAGSGTALSFSSTTNRITTSGYTYDAAGNLTADPSHAYTYDSENKILKLDTVLAYAYDGEGKRVRKYVGENTRFVYGIGGELLAEYNGSSGSITKEYLYGASGLTAVIDPTNGTEYLTPDHLGSPRVVSNSSATVTQRRDFMPFGEEVTSGAGRSSGSGWSASTAPRQKFTGYERDSESELDFAQARMYSSGHGRFTSVDPIVMTKVRLFDPQSINLYVYTRSNPLKYIDPTGEYFVGTDGKRVDVTVVDGMIRVGQNASKDLQRMATLINDNRSRTSMAQFMSIAGNDTKVNFRIERNFQKDRPGLLGLHQAHDKDGKALNWEANTGGTGKFDGTPAYIKDKDGNQIYQEASITIFEGNIENGLSGLRQGYEDAELTTQEYMVATFGHEGDHNTNQEAVNAIRGRQEGRTNNFNVETPAYMVTEQALREIRENRRLPGCFVF